MNKEYINREDLMGVREQAIWVYENANVLNARTIRDNLFPLLNKIVDAPAANVKEIKYGHWELAEDGDGVVCSECGTDFCVLLNETDDFIYCPHCGIYIGSGMY